MMMSPDKKTIEYTVACVGEFARATAQTHREAFEYLNRWGGIDFLLDCYDTEHLLSFEQAMEDLITVTRRQEKRGS